MLSREGSVRQLESQNFAINARWISVSLNMPLVRRAYGGNGARLAAAFGTFTGVSQPTCTEERTGSAPTGLVDCDNWSVSTARMPVAAIPGRAQSNTAK